MKIHHKTAPARYSQTLLEKNCWLFLWGIGLLAFFTALALWRYDYTDALQQVITSYNISNKAELLRTKYFTPVIYHTLRGLFQSLCLVYLLVLLAVYRQRLRLYRYIYRQARYIRLYYYHYLSKYFVISKRAWFLFCSVCFLFILMRIYHYSIYKIRVDEAFTFIYIVKKGFLSCLFYYPGPNNHILWSIFIFLFYKIGFNPILSLKIPCILTEILTLFIIFLFYNYNKKHKEFLIFIVLFYSSSFINHYYTQSRAYIALNLLFIIQLFFANLIIKNKLKLNILLFSIFSFIGFYLVPTYLIYYLILFLYIFSINKKIILNKSILLNIFINLLLVIILIYIPIILFNGIDDLIFNRHIISKDVHSKNYLINRIYNFLNLYKINLFSSDKTILILSLDSLFLIFLVYKNKLFKNLVLIFILYFFVLFMFYVFLGLNIPYRSILVVIFFYSYLLSEIVIYFFNIIFNKILIKNIFLYLLIIFWFLFFNIYEMYKYSISKDIYNSVYKTNYIIKNKKYKKICILEGTYQVLFKFSCIDKPDYEILDTHASESFEKYDVLVLPLAMRQRQHEKLKRAKLNFWFEDGFVEVYRRNGLE
ncbi:MAG: hypothetical protein EAZ67_01220 [Cytophagales bacterium]|nr:MAG: hypothetical protein EAZ67_01220 [Cytophagales bacterium]